MSLKFTDVLLRRFSERGTFKKDDHGRIIETPAEMCARVAVHVADGERRYGGDPTATADMFYESIARLAFLPPTRPRR